MARWRIIDGPNALGSPNGLDGEAYGFVIENAKDPAQRRLARVDISRSVLGSDPAGLMSEVREAVDSDGVTALEGFLEEPAPPERLLVSSTAIAPVADA